MKKQVLTGLLTLSLGTISTIAGQADKQKKDRPETPSTATQKDAQMVKKHLGYVQYRRNVRHLGAVKTR